MFSVKSHRLPHAALPAQHEAARESPAAYFLKKVDFTMYAMIRLGNGEFYTSPVFGHYDNVTATDDYERYLQQIHSRYYIVLNKEKTSLIKVHVFAPDTKYLILNVLIIDANYDDWQIDDNGFGGVNFLPKEKVLKMLEDHHIPNDILEKCLSMDAAFHYNPYPYIETQTDVDNLMTVSGRFHDARIAKLEKRGDDMLYILFDSVWGCSIEIWFEEDISYCIDSRDSEEQEPYWFGSSVILQDNYIYFVDEEEMSVDKINNNYCWFRARRMKYHVIPN